MSLFEIRIFGLVMITTFAAVSFSYSYWSFRNKARKKRIALLLELALVSSIASTVGWVRMFGKLGNVPTVLFSTPRNNNVITAHSPDIRVTFSAPVVYKTLAIHTNPPIDISTKPNGYLWNLLPFGTTLTIVPKNTLAPGEEIMVYLANIEGPVTHGFGGEQLLEMKVENPEVVDVDPPNESQQISTTQKFTLQFSAPILSKDEWNITSDPPHPFSIEQINSKTLSVWPNEPMQQGKTYKLTLFQTPIIISRTDKSIMQALDTRTKTEWKITTVKAAFVAGFTPSGNAVNPEDPIVITFDQPMNTATLEKFITIAPETRFDTNWTSTENKLTITHDDLHKDTDYTITLTVGIETEQGGTFNTDALFRFKTAGPLKLSDIIPADGDNNAQVTGSIKIIFDQKIPESIKDHIKISPSLEGTYKINDAILEFRPKNDLPHETKYTITIPSGAPGIYGLPSKEERMLSFRTKSDQVNLTIPFYRQQTQFTCNIAAARMLLAYRGISVSESEFINKVGIGGKRGSGNPHVGYIDDFGTFWEPILKGILQYRSARLLTSGSLTELLAETKKGNPVMTWGQNGWSDPHDISWTATDGTRIQAVNGMHSMVVRGYLGSAENPTSILINDPWRGQYSLSPDVFMRRWNYYKIAMVVE